MASHRARRNTHMFPPTTAASREARPDAKTAWRRRVTIACAMTKRQTASRNKRASALPFRGKDPQQGQNTI